MLLGVPIQWFHRLRLRRRNLPVPIGSSKSVGGLPATAMAPGRCPCQRWRSLVGHREYGRVPDEGALSMFRMWAKREVQP